MKICLLLNLSQTRNYPCWLLFDYGQMLKRIHLIKPAVWLKIHSVAGLTEKRGIVTTRPFRAPHHTISDAGLIGGGAVPRRAKCHWLIMAFFFLMNCRSLIAVFWRSYASHWKMDESQLVAPP